MVYFFRPHCPSRGGNPYYTMGLCVLVLGGGTKWKVFILQSLQPSFSAETTHLPRGFSYFLKIMILEENRGEGTARIPRVDFTSG